MSRIRTIKPEFWTSAQIVECSPIARLLFVGIWNFCDDFGNHPLSIKALKMRIFPGDDFTTQQVQQWFDELVNNGLIALYSHGETQYFHVKGWHHQKIDKPSRKFPEPTKFDEHSTSIRRTLSDESPAEGKGCRRDVEGKGCSQENSANSPASPESSSRKKAADEKLIAVCTEWNAWHSFGIVPSKIQNPTAPGKTLIDAWTRSQRDPEQRARLEDIPALRAAIEASQGMLKPALWFDAAGLIGGKNSNRRWYAEQLLNGTYRDKATGGKASHNPEAETAWQTVLDSLQRRSRFKPDEIMGDIGERAWQAVRMIGLKRLDEATEFDRRELKSKFIQAFSQGESA